MKNQKNKINFYSENLVVDYISFNITGCQEPTTIAKYLFKSFGFNSIFQETFKGKSTNILHKSTNQYRVTFVKSSYSPKASSYWTGIIVKFSGENAEYFYSLVQEHRIDWSIFNLACTNIGRFDLYYFRKYKTTDKNDLPEVFMKNSCEKVNSQCKNKKGVWKKTNKGLIMRIGNRHNSSYFRIYEDTKRMDHSVYSEIERGLKFELELKNQLIQSFQKLFFHNQLDEFEHQLIIRFFKYSKSYFMMDSCFTDWLRIGFRRLLSNKKTNTNLNFLVTSYLQKGGLEESFQKEQFFQLIQLLSFLRTIPYTVQFLDRQAYCIVEFSVIDFVVFKGGDKTSTYHRTKVLNFFGSLQELKPLLQKFCHEEFRKSVMFPYIKLQKINSKWSVTMAVGEEFYWYTFPFLLPKSLILYRTKYDLEIKLQLMESFCTVSIEKKLFLKLFLNKFSISNRDLAKIKQQFIDLFCLLKESYLIENTIVLIDKNGSYQETVDSLSVKVLAKTECLCFWEKL